MFGYVYFAQCGDKGNIKIGSAVDPLERIKTLQTGCPEKLNLLGVIITYGFREMESLLHEEFAAFRTQGEWFFPDEEIIHFIETHSVNWGEAENPISFLEAVTDKSDANCRRFWEDWTKIKREEIELDAVKKTIDSLHLPILSKCEAYRRCGLTPPIRMSMDEDTSKIVLSSTSEGEKPCQNG